MHEVNEAGSTSVHVRVRMCVCVRVDRIRREIPIAKRTFFSRRVDGIIIAERLAHDRDNDASHTSPPSIDNPLSPPSRDEKKTIDE